MPMTQQSYPFFKKDRLTNDVYSFWIDCPSLTALASPGQFVHVRVPGFLLRRPISICEMKGGALRLVFQIRGEGTREMAELEPGDLIDLLGPLGHGFALTNPAKASSSWGRIGTPPLLRWPTITGGASVFLGFRDVASVILAKDFEAAGASLTLATDDGSAGAAGFIHGPA